MASYQFCIFKFFFFMNMFGYKICKDRLPILDSHNLDNVKFFEDSQAVIMRQLHYFTLIDNTYKKQNKNK